MRGRATFACYKKMGVTDCVTTTPEQYVTTAVRIATDDAYRDFIRSRILSANEVLYDDIEAARELERFFCQAVQAARGGTSMMSAKEA